MITHRTPAFSCGHCVPPQVASPPSGHRDEAWQTIGGGSIRVTRCFPCRGLVEPLDEADPRWTPPHNPAREASPETLEE